MPIKILPPQGDLHGARTPSTERARARDVRLELSDDATNRGDHELAAMALRLRDLR